MIYACESDAEFARVCANLMTVWYLGGFSVNVIHAKGAA